jgi:hypothetical protein
VTTAPGQRRSSNNRRLEIWRIIFWSGLTNLVLLSVFLASERFELRSIRNAYSKMVDDKAWRMGERSENSIGPVKTMGDFSTSTTTVAKSEPDSSTAERETSSEEAMKASTVDLALAAGASVGDSEDLSVKPILAKNPQTGKLEIGNFKSLSLVGSPEDCLDFGRALLSDAMSSGDKLDIVAAAHEITIARICAVNGSIIITCRAGQIAVSPRKSRPDDHCTDKG